MKQNSNRAGTDLLGPEDSVRLYRVWAPSYDSVFAVEAGYVYPAQIARLYRDAGGEGPVLDAGGGTGLVAEAMPEFEIDGIDISPEMLDIAAGKGVYRNSVVADLTQPLDIPDDSYAGVVSAGTFTNGHVNADCLDELVRVGRDGACFVLGINEQVLEGFSAKLAHLVAAGAVGPVAWHNCRVFAEGASHPNAEDIAMVAVFRRRARGGG